MTCFFAREDTKTPLYVSIFSVMVNIILSVLLISSMREMGIALATAISAWINTILLFLILYKDNNFFLESKLVKNSLKIVLATLIMMLTCYFLNQLMFTNIADLSTILNVSNLFLVIICSKIIYLLMIFMLKVISIRDLKGYIQK